MAQEGNQSLESDRLVNRPFTHESAYGTENPNEPRTQIRKLLADITYPLSVEQRIAQDIHMKRKNMINENLEYQDNLYKSHEESPIEALERHLGIIRRIQERYTDYDRERIRNKMQELITLPKMGEFRARAQALSKRYEESNTKDHSSTEAYFMRESSKLWLEMQKYVDSYFEHASGYYHINLSDKNPEVIADEMLQKVAKNREMSQTKTEKQNPEFILPVESREHGNWNGNELIEVFCDDENKIVALSFDTTETPHSVCSSIDELAAAYQSGIKLTNAQIALLKQYGKIPTRQDAAIPRVVNTTAKTPPRPTPIWMFPYLLPDELAMKLIGRSKGDYYMNMGQVVINNIRINLREHDFGYYQFRVTLDTKGLDEEDVTKLLATYIKAQQDFPSIALPK